MRRLKDAVPAEAAQALDETDAKNAPTEEDAPAAKEVAGEEAAEEAVPAKKAGLEVIDAPDEASADEAVKMQSTPATEEVPTESSAAKEVAPDKAAAEVAAGDAPNGEATAEEEEGPLDEPDTKESATEEIDKTEGEAPDEAVPAAEDVAMWKIPYPGSHIDPEAAARIKQEDSD